MVTIVSDPLNTYQNKVGAGGFIIGGSVHPTSGRAVYTVDVWNAYIRDSADTAWRPLLTTANLPASVMARERLYQCWVLSVAIAKSDQNYIAADASGYVLLSTNGGTTFTETNFPAQTTPGQASNNGTRRLYNDRLVFDPTDKNTIYRGHYVPSLQVSFDGGATVSSPATFPAPTTSGTSDSGVCGICVDTSSALTSGRHSRVMANSHGNGWYVSTDGGSTWSAVAGSQTTRVTHAAMNSVGDLFVCDGTSTVRKYTKSGGTWSTLSGVTVAAWTIAIEPGNDNRILLSNAGAPSPQFQQSADGGGTWGTAFSATRDTNGEVYWIGIANPSTFATSKILFDPLVTNRVWVADGLGVLRGTIAPGATSVTFSDYSNGIEELVGHNMTIAPNNNQIFTITHDRNLVRKGNPDANARDYQFRTELEAAIPTTVLQNGCNLEYMVTNPRFMLHASSYFDRVSRDGGFTWSSFNSPAWRRVASSQTDICSTTSGSPLVTIEKGSTHANSTSVTTGTIEITNSVSIGGLTLSGVYPCTYPTTTSFRIDAGSNASSTVTNGGGTITYRFGWGDYSSGGQLVNAGPVIKRYIPIDETRWIAEGGQNTGIWRTTDAGVTWTRLTWPDSSGDETFSWSADTVAIVRQIVAVDYATPGTVLFFGGNGVYKTTDYGATITKVSASAVEPFTMYSNRSRFAPGVAGTCFYAGGQVGGITPAYPTAAFVISRDTGATWTRISSVWEVWCFAFGPVVSPSTVPALYIYGNVGTTGQDDIGLYCCTDWSATDTSTWTWRKFCGHPMSNINSVKAIAADFSNWRRVYGTFEGAGYWYAADAPFSDGAKTYLARSV